MALWYMAGGDRRMAGEPRALLAHPGLEIGEQRRRSLGPHSEPLLPYNLGNFMRTLALPKDVEHWSLTTLHEKLIKIDAKIVRHGRYITFQLVFRSRHFVPMEPRQSASFMPNRRNHMLESQH